MGDLDNNVRNKEVEGYGDLVIAHGFVSLLDL